MLGTLAVELTQCLLLAQAEPSEPPCSCSSYSFLEQDFFLLVLFNPIPMDFFKCPQKAFHFQSLFIFWRVQP